MATAVSVLVAEVVEHGVDTLALLTDAVDDVFVGRKGSVEQEFVLEITSLGEAVLKITVEDGLSRLYKPLVASLFTIFDGVETVEDSAAAEAKLSGRVGLTVIAAERVARVIFDGLLIHISLAEIVGQLSLHLSGRVEWSDRLWAQLVDAQLPHLSDVLAEILGPALMDHPS